MSAEERKKEAAWFDVGIIKGTSCTVSSYYLPNGELEKTEIDVEVQLQTTVRVKPVWWFQTIYRRTKLSSSECLLMYFLYVL